MASDWEVRFSNSRQRAYFFSPSTQSSVWEPPAGLTDAEVLALPGAAEHLGGAGAGAEGGPARPSKVRASHLLIKHSGSRRPSSWKSDRITRSKDEAIAILREHQGALLKAREDGGEAALKQLFADRAGTESDCSSARNGGDLGSFGPKQMQKPFEDASFALPVGGMSDVIETDSGVHLILRTE